MKLAEVGVREKSSDGEADLSRRVVQMTFDCCEVVLHKFHDEHFRPFRRFATWTGSSSKIAATRVSTGAQESALQTRP
jgi:hypothetical protein